MVLGIRYGIEGYSGHSGYSGATGSGSGDTVKVAATDTTSDYLLSKLVAGSGITLVEENIGNDEYITIALYVAPSVSLGGGSTVEKGLTIANVALSWTCNKTMITRVLSSPVPSLDRDRGFGGSDSYTHTGANLTTNTTYSITVGDGTRTSSSSTSCSFLNRRYYGVNENTSLANAMILALSKEFCSGKSNTHTYNCTAGTYIWICYPVSFGAATFTVGGLEVTFTLTTQDVTNDSGYLESFRCYRSTDLQHGSDITVVVS